jgi:hypothetical protein
MTDVDPLIGEAFQLIGTSCIDPIFPFTFYFGSQYMPGYAEVPV